MVAPTAPGDARRSLAVLGATRASPALTPPVAFLPMHIGTAGWSLSSEVVASFPGDNAEMLERFMRGTVAALLGYDRESFGISSGRCHREMAN